MQIMYVHVIYRSDLYTDSRAQKRHHFRNKIRKVGGTSTTDDDDFFDIEEILGMKSDSSSTNNTTSEPTPLDPDNLEVMDKEDRQLKNRIVQLQQEIKSAQTYW